MTNEQEVFDALKYRIEVDTRGTRWYYNSANQLHRECGPAITDTNGNQWWYQNNLLHRVDGPAVECTGGGVGRYWYQNGLLHREDGPAIIFEDGDKRWYINGVRLTEAEFNQRVINV